MLKNQQKAQDMLAPHYEVLRFLESHFCATRLGNPQDQRLFGRFVDATTVGLLRTHGHPLAREIHFRIVLFGLKALKHFDAQSNVGLWKAKDQILSAALSWFKHPARWSFGGNRLQLKAEERVLGDVAAALRSVSGIASQTRGSCKSLQAKQDLLQVFIENEMSRLKVWLSPLESERKHYMSPISGGKNSLEVSLCPHRSSLTSICHVSCSHLLIYIFRMLHLCCAWLGPSALGWLFRWPAVFRPRN